jgi:hypothetical protein
MPAATLVATALMTGEDHHGEVGHATASAVTGFSMMIFPKGPDGRLGRSLIDRDPSDTP